MVCPMIKCHRLARAQRIQGPAGLGSTRGSPPGHAVAAPRPAAEADLRQHLSGPPQNPRPGPHTGSRVLREASGAGHPKSAQGAATLGGAPSANVAHLRKSSGAGAHGWFCPHVFRKSANESTGREAATETSLPQKPGKPRPPMRVSPCTLTGGAPRTRGEEPQAPLSGRCPQMGGAEAFSRQTQMQMGVSCPQWTPEGVVMLARAKLGSNFSAGGKGFPSSQQVSLGTEIPMGSAIPWGQSAARGPKSSLAPAPGLLHKDVGPGRLVCPGCRSD